MTIVADESVDFGIISELRNAGFNVLAVVKDYPGISDEEVIDKANELNAITLTEDKDFGELTFRTKIKNNGIVLLRFAGLENAEKAKISKTVIVQFQNELLNAFTVITAQRVRIKKYRTQ